MITTVAKAAEIVGKTRQLIYYLIKTGKVAKKPNFGTINTIGRGKPVSYMVDTDEIIEYFSNRWRY